MGRPRHFGRRLWKPSQNGGVRVCLQPHNQSRPERGVTVNGTGCKGGAAAWLPSHSGGVRERPQAHHK